MTSCCQGHQQVFTILIKVISRFSPRVDRVHPQVFTSSCKSCHMIVKGCQMRKMLQKSSFVISSSCHKLPCGEVACLAANPWEFEKCCSLGHVRRQKKIVPRRRKIVPRKRLAATGVCTLVRRQKRRNIPVVSYPTRVIVEMMIWTPWRRRVKIWREGGMILGVWYFFYCTVGVEPVQSKKNHTPKITYS